MSCSDFHFAVANQSRCGIIQDAMNAEDEHWMARAREGDAQAFRCLVEPHMRPMFGLCARITRDSGLAEDAVQEGLFNAWRHLSSFAQAAEIQRQTETQLGRMSAIERTAFVMRHHEGHSLSGHSFAHTVEKERSRRDIFSPSCDEPDRVAGVGVPDKVIVPIRYYVGLSDSDVERAGKNFFWEKP